jgi:hypothetical protein
MQGACHGVPTHAVIQDHCRIGRLHSGVVASRRGLKPAYTGTRMTCRFQVQTHSPKRFDGAYPGVYQA